LREYRRDVARFLAREREDYPALPLGYFNDDAAAMAEAFQTLALRERHSELIAEFPKSALEARLHCPLAGGSARHLRKVVRLSQRPEGGAADRRRALARSTATPDLARLAARRAPAGPQFTAVSAAETPVIYALLGSLAI
jgi:hypothetical protein